MKFRKSFVTNSSSSSFILSISIETKDNNSINFSASGGTPESGRIDYFDEDAIVTVSPKQLGTAKDVEELITLLTEGVVDGCEWDTEIGTRIFEKSNPVSCFDYENYNPELDEQFPNLTLDAYDFVKEIREKVKTMDDIAKIIISGDEENYMQYCQTYTYDRTNDKYTGHVIGCEFEKDGASGGVIIMPDLEECEIEYEDVDD